MKKIILYIVIFFSSITISSVSFGNWKKFYTDENGNVTYVDIEGIKKHKDFYYVRTLYDLLEPDVTMGASYSRYDKVDCKLFRTKNLSLSFHPQPMGKGVLSTDNSGSETWIYASRSPRDIKYLKRFCNFIR